MSISWRRIKNPDQSLSGLIGNDVEIGVSVFVDPSAIVLPGSVVLGGVRIGKGSIMTPDGEILTEDWQ